MSTVLTASMPLAPYTLWLSTANGERLAVLAPLALRYHRVLNAVGWLNVVLPWDARLRRCVAVDSRLELWHDGANGPVLVTGTVWLVRYVAVRRADDGAALLELGAVSAVELVSRRIVAYAAGTAESTKTGPADDLVKALVRENLLSPSDAARALPYFAVAADTGAAPVVSKSCARRPLLAVVQELAAQSAAAGLPLWFDVGGGYGGQPFRFETATGVPGHDHGWPNGRPPVTLTAEGGTLGAVTRATDWSTETTVVYAGGQGIGPARQVIEVADPGRSTASPFNRRERFVEARHAATATLLTAEGHAALAAGQPRRPFVATVAAGPGNGYGSAWRWGDRVVVAFADEVWQCVVYSITTTIEAGTETISAELRSD